jgi:hypothetical protein
MSPLLGIGLGKTAWNGKNLAQKAFFRHGND